MKAGKLLHIITLIELFAGYFIFMWIYEFQVDNLLQAGFRLYGLFFIASLPVFAQLDARSRYQNYKQLRDQFIQYGYDTRILNPVLKSRCQRDAAILAAKSTGYQHLCSDYFRTSGYRWYHLFPDFVFTHPQFLITKYFWKTTFFCPTYRSKLNLKPSQLLFDRNNMIPTLIENG
ncbi:MAG: hypothetical protein KQI35_07135 [Bacteroidetes bacterium]|nr:hypothetical protein [Bacteroidota bacterium]